MAKDKRQYPLKVVVHRPYARLIFGVFLAAMFAGAIVASYLLGHKHRLRDDASSLKELVALRNELGVEQARAAELEQKLANIHLGAEVDRKASEDVRSEVVELKAKLTKVAEQNSFYRNLMAPADNKRGLTFGAVEIIDTQRPRDYAYKIVVQQLAINHQVLKGTLKFSVVGRKNDREVRFALRDISDQVDAESIKLRFKYFQTIEGRLKLPEGFEPKRIELVARSTGKKAMTVEKRFGWLVEEA